MSFGDTDSLDPYSRFDQKDQDGEFTRELKTVIMTFVIFIISSIVLYLILMNLCIAVIWDTYVSVDKCRIVNDYKLRIKFIYQLEVLFKPSDFINEVNFPAFLIIRRKMEPRSEKLNEASLGYVSGF